MNEGLVITKSAFDNYINYNYIERDTFFTIIF